MNRKHDPHKEKREKWGEAKTYQGARKESLNKVKINSKPQGDVASLNNEQNTATNNLKWIQRRGQEEGRGRSRMTGAVHIHQVSEGHSISKLRCTLIQYIWVSTTRPNATHFYIQPKLHDVWVVKVWIINLKPESIFCLNACIWRSMVNCLHFSHFKERCRPCHILIKSCTSGPFLGQATLSSNDIYNRMQFFCLYSTVSAFVIWNVYLCVQ